jgi:multidrug efflux pump subunit AcrA (membrane-fusion protein)
MKRDEQRMKTKWNRAGLILMLLVAGCGRSKMEAPRTTTVVRGAIRMTVPFQGELEARRVEMIAVGVQGSAVLAELAAEGSRVAAGDLLARFDASQIEQDLARQENDLVRARQELESLEKAELPMELLDMESKRMEACTELEAEENFLESARGLLARGLMSEGEVAQQERKVEGLRTREAQLETRQELTSKHVHAARLAKARAALEAAEHQHDFTARQLALCEVRAPVAGVATLVPLPVGGEYRTAHVGDTLFRNQVFLCLPDPAEHVVRGYVGEAELPWVQVGNAVEAVPAAYPGVRLTGHVESVGGMAQTRPGQPVWRKFFPVQIALDAIPEPMPIGISVSAEIVAGESTHALLLPREAIEWRDSQAVAWRLSTKGIPEELRVQTGLADATHLEIIAGLSEGDRVRLP